MESEYSDDSNEVELLTEDEELPFLDMIYYHIKEDSNGKSYNVNELYESFKSLPEVTANKVCTFYESTITGMDNTDSIITIFDSFSVCFYCNICSI